MRSVNIPPYALTILQWLFLALLATLAYLPGLDGSFTFDDISNIVFNPKIHATDLFSTLDALHSPFSSNRPLAMLSFALNHWRGGLDSSGYHLVNLLLHIANAVLLLRLSELLLNSVPSDGANVLYQKRQVAFWGTVLWMLNPVQVHAVTYVVQRMTVLATSFYLLALIAYVSHRQGRLTLRATVVAIALCFFLGMASKEIVATLPFALLLVEIIFFDGLSRQIVIWLGGSALAIFAVLAWLYLPNQWAGLFITLPDRNFSPWERVLTEARVLWYYLSLLSFPLPGRLLVSYENYPLSHSLLNPPTTLLAIVGLMGLGVGTWQLRRRTPFLAFSLLFFLLASSLEASFVNIEIAFLHRIYLPSLFLTIGLLAAVPLRFATRIMPLLLLLTVALAIGTQQRNESWVTEAGLWQGDLRNGDKTTRTILNLAIGLGDIGRAAEAIPLLEQTLSQTNDPGSRLRTLLLLGRSNYYTGHCDRALPFLERLHQEFGSWTEARFFEGICLLEEGRNDEASTIANEQITDRLGHYYGIVLQAQLAQRAGDHVQARTLLTEALVTLPQKQLSIRTLLRLHLANLELSEKQPQAAYQLYLQIIEDTPDNYFAWTQIYHMQMAANDREHAAKIRIFLESRGIKIEKER
ncbi:protein O-mannosyl-transferase [Gammaproteobacteria bacterium]